MTKSYLLVFSLFLYTILTTIDFATNNLDSKGNSIAAVITSAILEMAFIRSSWQKTIHLPSCTS